MPAAAAHAWNPDALKNSASWPLVSLESVAGWLPVIELPVLAQPERIRLVETIKQIAVRLSVNIMFKKSLNCTKKAHLMPLTISTNSVWHQTL
ncbi:hypothetical protein D3C80_1574920 [compost metagenome]